MLITIVWTPSFDGVTTEKMSKTKHKKNPPLLLKSDGFFYRNLERRPQIPNSQTPKNAKAFLLNYISHSHDFAQSVNNEAVLGFVRFFYEAW